MKTKAYSALLSLKKSEPLNTLLDPEMIGEYLPGNIQEKSKTGLRQMGIDGDLAELGSNALSTIMNNAKEFIAGVKKIKATGGELESLEIDFLRDYNPNAITIFVEEDNSYALGFSDSLYIVYQQILLASIRTLYAKSENNSFKHSKEELDRLLSTIDIIIKCHFHKGSVPVSTVQESLLELIESTKEYWGRTADIAQFFINFVIAHELGHIALGHLNNDISGLCLASFDTTAKVTDLNLEKEYQADEWGWNTLMGWLKDYPEDQPFAIEAPCIYFAVASIIEKYGPPQTRLGEYLQQTHPPAVKRAECLRYLSKNRIDDKQDRFVDFFRSISDLLLAVSENLTFEKS